jgi:hypothetical protein
LHKGGLVLRHQAPEGHHRSPPKLLEGLS